MKLADLPWLKSLPIAFVLALLKLLWLDPQKGYAPPLAIHWPTGLTVWFLTALLHGLPTLAWPVAWLIFYQGAEVGLYRLLGQPTGPAQAFATSLAAAGPIILIAVINDFFASRRGKPGLASERDRLILLNIAVGLIAVGLILALLVT